MRLKEKIAVITGAGSGIGEATAELFAREGARVVLAGRRPEPLEELAARLRQADGECLAAPTDVTNEDQVRALFKEAVERFGRVDVVFNNAGVGGRVTDIRDLEEEKYQRCVDINIKGVMLCCKHAMALMVEQGSGVIINNASIAGLEGISSSPLYGPTKAAVINLTQCMALQHARHGVRVNAVSPGWVATPMTRQAGPKKMAEFSRTIPLGRYAEPLEVAYGVLFLAGDEASYVTGANLVIDGALSAGRIVER